MGTQADDSIFFPLPHLGKGGIIPTGHVFQAEARHGMEEGADDGKAGAGRGAGDPRRRPQTAFVKNGGKKKGQVCRGSKRRALM